MTDGGAASRGPAAEGFTHLDARGQARMVDVGDKPATERVAVARGRVLMRPETAAMVADAAAAKGDVLAVARVAGIMAAKETARLIPLCHPLALASVRVDFQLDPAAGVVDIQATVRTVGPTGAEMEALTAVSVAALTVYDMCKAVDRAMVISDIRLVAKSGGRSGSFCRPGEADWPEADAAAGPAADEPAREG